MQGNEILEEIWKFREEFAARHGYDLHSMIQEIKQQAAEIRDVHEHHNINLNQNVPDAESATR